jgi:hypothetical protein
MKTNLSLVIVLKPAEKIVWNESPSGKTSASVF